MMQRWQHMTTLCSCKEYGQLESQSWSCYTHTKTTCKMVYIHTSGPKPLYAEGEKKATKLLICSIRNWLKIPFGMSYKMLVINRIEPGYNTSCWWITSLPKVTHAVYRPAVVILLLYQHLLLPLLPYSAMTIALFHNAVFKCHSASPQSYL